MTYEMKDDAAHINSILNKEHRIKEIKNAANIWIMKQLIEEERIRSCEERYKNLLYFYNENTSRKYS